MTEQEYDPTQGEHQQDPDVEPGTEPPKPAEPGNGHGDEEEPGSAEDGDSG